MKYSLLGCGSASFLICNNRLLLFAFFIINCFGWWFCFRTLNHFRICGCLLLVPLIYLHFDLFFLLLRLFISWLHCEVQLCLNGLYHSLRSSLITLTLVLTLLIILTCSFTIFMLTIKILESLQVFLLFLTWPVIKHIQQIVLCQTLNHILLSTLSLPLWFSKLSLMLTVIKPYSY